MKKFLFLLLLPVMAIAANQVVNRVDGPWVLFKGSVRVATAPTVDQCIALAVPLNPPRKTWSCKATTTFETQLVAVPPTPPTCAMCPPVDKTKIMVPVVGIASDMYQPPSGHPSGDGAFRPQCATSHMNFDDNILFPGVPGASHLHTYWGNTNANANSTGSPPPGNGTCQSIGTGNLSQMWAPTPVQDGRPIIARDNMVYYKGGGILPASSIQDIPEGLTFVFGNTMQSYTPQPKYISHYTFSCVDPKTGMGTTTPDHPDGEYPTIPACAVGNEIWLSIIAPNCWDGVHIDSDDHRKHMAYSSGSSCPADHPVPIATITFNIHYVVAPGDDTTRWFLSSDMYYGMNPANYGGGLTAHADYRGGWVKEHMHDFMERCVRVSIDCG